MKKRGKGWVAFHLLLVDRQRAWRVIDLAEVAGIVPSYAVKILKELVQSGWVALTGEGYRVTQPKALLDFWAQSHSFEAQASLRSYVVAGDPETVERRLVDVANRLNARYALTLFAGARHRAPFVRFPVVHCYWEGDQAPLVGELQARPVSEGGNLALARPADESAFVATQVCDGARVVSDVRLYVDLYSFPARGREQAEFLLETVMPDLRPEDSPAVQAALHSALALRDEADRAMNRQDWRTAADLYEKAASAFAALGTPSGLGAEKRARLLLWMSLARLAFQRRDPEALARARAICVTASEVEALRRDVGYNATHVGLALLAYFAALSLTTADSVERERYVQKARAHYVIIKSPYAESPREVAQDADEIVAALAPLEERR